MGRIVSLLLLVAFCGTAHAATVTYRLTDHGDGELGPDYGLRFDGLSGLSDFGKKTTFSAAPGLFLTYDDMALTAEIYGTVSLNDPADPGLAGNYTVSYTLGDLTPRGDGFIARSGAGTFSGPGLDSILDITGKKTAPDPSAYVAAFLFDGHRLGGGTTPVLRGWIMRDGQAAGCCSDFLVQASVVPIPAALPLFATGLAGVGALGWRRRRREARQGDAVAA